MFLTRLKFSFYVQIRARATQKCYPTSKSVGYGIWGQAIKISLNFYNKVETKKGPLSYQAMEFVK